MQEQVTNSQTGSQRESWWEGTQSPEQLLRLECALPVLAPPGCRHLGARPVHTGPYLSEQEGPAVAMGPGLCGAGRSLVGVRRKSPEL